jgi:surfactin synthase thioesterase subunit
MAVTRRRSTVHSAWIRQFHDPGAGGCAPDRPVLVCFPHAGGSASTFIPLSEELSAGAEVLVAQYPGRQDRMAEPALADLRQMADQAAQALLPWRDRPVALFGHSMGSLVAYEVALRLELRWGRTPVGLFVSSRVAPSLSINRGVHTMDDERLAMHLAKLSGTPPALLADKDLLAAILPAVRADYRAIETYQDREGFKVGCPISGFCGDKDAGVPLDGLAKWADYTTAQWTSRLFDGGHFYLQPRGPELARAVLEDLAAFTRPAGQPSISARISGPMPIGAGR